MMKIETLYYTIHDYVEEYGESSVINLYQIKDNQPVLCSELSRNLDSGLSIMDELELHVEDWEEESTTYVFTQL